MRFTISSSLKALVITYALIAAPAMAQSLSVVRKAAHSFSVEANAPAGDPQTLQASANLRLWVDVQSNLAEPFSLALTNDWTPLQFYRLTPPAPEPPPIRIIVIGDSLSADCCGWGAGLYGYFKPNATVINYAQPATSTKYFLQAPEYSQMMLVKPDYVLMSFGSYDGFGDPDRTTTIDEFKGNLRTIAQSVRSFNGVPIMVTIHAARLWDTNGNLLPTTHPYIPAMKEVAAEINTPCIDLDTLSRALFTKLGQEGCAFMHFEQGGTNDYMHFSPLGAVYAAQLVVNALPESLGPYLTGILEHPPRP